MLYIDTLRIVSQGTIYDNYSLEKEDVDFFLLGSFDAMKIITHKSTSNVKIDSLSDLIELNRLRHKGVHVLFDRQPLYLYSAGNNSPILSGKDKYADLPLVMALVQIQDEAMNLDDPEALIIAFKNHIETLLHNFDADEENIEFEVFYDLGEADVVIVFRAPNIRNIGRVLFWLRGWEKMKPDEHRGIRVLSVCSHCAFPRQENIDIFSQKLNTWIAEEQKNGSKFVTFVDTSFGMDVKDEYSRKHFAFDQYMIGAYDFSGKKAWDTSAFAERCTYIALQLQKGNDQTFPFRTALSIPIVQLEEADIEAYPVGRTIEQIRPKDKYALLDEYDSKQSTHFKELAMYIMVLSSRFDSFWGNNESALQLERDIESLNMTLIGLLKHLIRLKEGRFEGDLYAFVAPVFEQLPKIAVSYHDLISHLADVYQTVKNDPAEAQDISNRIYALYQEYVTDAARLITGLQHLLSVLSVSPHNYLETYGSNMRSISATCKLLAAYQGVTYGVAKYFDMKLLNPQRGEKDVETKEVLLVLPYRRISQSTRTLFEHSSPVQRIATIRLDYSSMMDIDQTLIVLLHEVGHHIMTSDFRSARQRPLQNAVFAFLLQEGLGDIFSRPIDAICEPINTHEIAQTKAAQIEWVLKKGEEELVNKSIQDKIKGVARPIVESLTESFKMQEDGFIRAVIKKEEQFALKNKFSMMQRKALNNFIEEKLKSSHQDGKQNEFKPDDICFVLSIEKLYVDAVYDCFEQFVSEQRKRKMLTESNDLWRLDELFSYYREVKRYQQKRKEYMYKWEQYRIAEKKRRDHSDWPQPQKPEECMPGMLKRNIKNMLEHIEINHGACVEEITTFLFGDIYSDAFAFYMLRLDEETTEKETLADQYLKTIKDTAAFEANRHFDKYYVLQRIYIVLTKFYELEEKTAMKKMSHTLSTGTGVSSSENIEKNIRFICDSMYYEYVSEFAYICKDSLLNKRKSSPNMDEITRKLNALYNGARIRLTDSMIPKVREELRMKKTKAVAEGIHYFWKLSTTRG